MNKLLLIGLLVVGLVALIGLAYAHGMGNFGMASSRGFWPGGYHMGRMMGSGWQGGCCPMGQYGHYGMSLGGKVTKDNVQDWVQEYLYRLGNPNLKQGKIRETDDGFEVEIVTKDNSLVEKLLVDKDTGWMKSTY
ncbi:MAG: hypothetical protein JSV97_04285 [candidate division WOR-3 bacterium]|nr:MAG: hypothetical protein JSV97_04285 [candidate division WOR-3 bacterium]